MLPMSEILPKQTRVAVILPCYNEETAVADTVKGFREALPEAEIFVFDNNSADRTREMAIQAGALVREERRQGKGNVIRRAFADVEADVYVMADGDGTYDAMAVRPMLRLMQERGLDMVTGIRKHQDPRAYRAGHVLGNRLFNHIVARLFGSGMGDLFSGYRVLSHRFVKSFPAMSHGFEIEAEMSIHALQLRMPIAEHESTYAPRRAGSQSKLDTFRDGWRILGYVIRLQRLYRPRQFFGTLGTLIGGISLALGIPIVITFLEIGQVPRFPTAILAMGLALLGALFWLLGIVLESTSQLALEMKLLRYLALPPPHAAVDLAADHELGKSARSGARSAQVGS
jgi:glycosyltransferase involved in cell wall biosynthesis